jgi:hypothetical protein
VSRAKSIDDRKYIHLSLGALDRARLKRIVTEVVRRDRSMPNQSRAVRWALRELEARIAAEQTTSRDSGTVTWRGPVTEVPE